MKTPLALAFVALCMVACTPQAPVVDDTESPSSVNSMTNSYLGLSETDAEAKAEMDGVPFRVVMRDGEALAVTMDYRPGRINATVENDIVVSYEVEGFDGSASSVSYDQNSWRTMISPFCMSFYDGCNTCHRMIDSDDAACTKKGCQQYEEPRCLDGEQ